MVTGLMTMVGGMTTVVSRQHFLVNGIISITCPLSIDMLPATVCYLALYFHQHSVTMNLGTTNFSTNGSMSTNVL